jgi:hypothetical protein
VRLRTDTMPPCLLAPGVPDWIGADGARLGWVLRDALFVMDGTEVMVVPLPAEVRDVAVSEDCWTVALPNGVVGVDPSAGVITHVMVDEDADPVDVVPGADLVLFAETPSHRLVYRADGVPVSLPDAATRARHLRPWSVGRGACWVDFDTLYRMRDHSRVSALGRVSGAKALAVGPYGACLVETARGVIAAAPTGLTVSVAEELDVTTARFSPDGRQALAACEDGVVLVELLTGDVRRRWEGALAPVGFLPGAEGPEAVVWEVASGRVVTSSGHLVLAGFAGAVPAQADRMLVGPGGAAWRLPSLDRLRIDLADGVVGTDGVRIAHVVHGRLRVGTDVDVPHGLGGEDDVVERVLFVPDGVMLVTAEGRGQVYALPAGDRIREVDPAAVPADDEALPDGVTLADPDSPSQVRDGDRCWPVPADGALRAGDDLVVWTDDGMLLRL